jgi:hypothetical protein
LLQDCQHTQFAKAADSAAEAVPAAAAGLPGAAGQTDCEQQQQQQQSVLLLPAHCRPGPTEQQLADERAAAAAVAAQIQPFTLQVC